ncbi:FAD-binding oxidoreductase, partial [Chloroflexota bacterium]
MSDIILKGLTTIVGKANVSDDPSVLEAYSRDQSFVPARKPNYVVRPGKVEEVEEIVRLANSSLMPVIPFSSGTDFHGGAVPVQGGILMDLRRLNKIGYIDERNWNALVEPGVTYAQLQAELDKRHL